MQVSMRSSKNFNIGVGNHQSGQANEHEGNQVSGQVIIKGSRHGHIRSSRHVNRGACDHQSE